MNMDPEPGPNSTGHLGHYLLQALGVQCALLCAAGAVRGFVCLSCTPCAVLCRVLAELVLASTPSGGQ